MKGLTVDFIETVLGVVGRNVVVVSFGVVVSVVESVVLVVVFEYWSQSMRGLSGSPNTH